MKGLLIWIHLKIVIFILYTLSTLIDNYMRTLLQIYYSVFNKEVIGGIY